LAWEEGRSNWFWLWRVVGLVVGVLRGHVGRVVKNTVGVDGVRLRVYDSAGGKICY